MNTAEYSMFRQYEMEQGRRAFKSTTIVHLPDQLPILVHHPSDRGPNSTPISIYSYVQSRFGVVRTLSEDGLSVDKTMLCFELDKALRLQEETNAAKL